LPEATSSVARISRRIGPTSWLAKVRPIHTAEISRVSDSMTNTAAKPSSMLRRWDSKLANTAETCVASRATLSDIGSAARAA